MAFQPQTKAELQTAVDLWVDDNSTALSTYGEINTWDVSLITDMSNLFMSWNGFYNNFNDDISNWDVSNVTIMHQMFYKASGFNQPLNDWDVSWLKLVAASNICCIFVTLDTSQSFKG